MVTPLTVGHERAGRPRAQVAVPRFVPVEHVVQLAGPPRLREELRPEPDQPARGDQVLHADPAGAVVDHVLHAALAEREQLRDDTQVLLGRVDRHSFDGLVELAVDRARHHLRLADRELEPLTAHHLDQHRKLQLAAALHLPTIGAVAGQHADRDVADDLLIQAPLHQPRGELVAVLPGRRRRVDADRHRERGLVDVGQRQRTRVVGVGERLPDRHLVQAGHGDDLARARLFHIDAVELLGDVQLDDLRRFDRAVGATPRHGLATPDRAVAHPAEREPSEVRRGVEVGHQRLERVALFVLGSGDVILQRLEQRLQVVGQLVRVRTASPRARVGSTGSGTRSDARPASRSMNNW